MSEPQNMVTDIRKLMGFNDKSSFSAFSSGYDAESIDRNAFISLTSTFREFGGNNLNDRLGEEAVDKHVIFRDEIAAEMNFDPE
jgi:hypothetical protein